MNTVLARPPAIVAALLSLTAMQEARPQLLRHVEREWQSVTFSGVRHEIELEFSGEKSVALGEALMDAIDKLEDFVIGGEMIVEASVIAIERVVWSNPRLRASIEVLTLKGA